ncbi:MAG: type II secretion system protein [Planctomycetota bacterium]|jgi:prepilin-type N-terminal cleavage/methylation domain-containing protein
MDGKQKGFTLIEILVVVTIIGVLAGLVVVLIPKGQFEAQKTECMSNIRNIVGLLEFGQRYPEYSGPNLILYLVKKGEIEGRDRLGLLFCSGDTNDTLNRAGGEDAYKDLDLEKRGEYDHLTSYSGRDQLNKACAAKKGSSKTFILVCDDSEDHHDNKGFVVGLNGGAAKWRDKVDDYKLDIKTAIEAGEGSTIEELQCLRSD